MRILKKILLILFVTLFIIITGIGVLVYKKSDQVKGYVLEQVNQAGEGVVKVESVGNLSFLEAFPSVSLSLNKLTLHNLWPDDQAEMLTANQLTLSFDILDLIKNRITIHTLSIEDGTLLILKNKKGLYNYQTGDTLNNSFLTSVRAVSMTNTHISYQDKGKELIQLLLEKGTVVGDITNKISSLEVKAAAVFYPSWDFLSMHEHRLEIDGILGVNRDSEQWTITKTMINNRDFSADLSGSFTTNDKVDLDLKFYVDETNLSSLNSYLTQETVNQYQNEVNRADFAINGSIKGSMSASSSLNLLANIEVRDAQLQFKDYSFENTRADILLSSTNASDLNAFVFDFKEVKTEVKGEELLLEGNLINVSKPIVGLTFISTIEANLFNMFLPDDWVVKQGEVYPNIEVKLLYDQDKTVTEMLLNGFVRLEDVNIGFMQTNSLNDLAGTVTFENQSMDMQKDAFPSFIATLSATEIQYDQIMITALQANTSCNGSDFAIEESSFDIFEGQGNVRGNYHFKDSIQDKQATLILNSTLTNISINTFFEQFNNFNQTAITDQNIEGISNVQIQAVLPYEHDKVNMDKLTAQASVQIKDGKLQDVQTFADMCDYIEEKRIMRKVIDIASLREKTKEISFSTLNNTIQVKDRKVFIPKMLISSSALELELEGIHSFDQHIEYRFDFFLSDLMKKEGVEHFEDYEIENTDRKWLKLSMLASGTVDKPAFSWNKKKQKEIMRERIEQEKKIAKKIIKDEFNGNADPVSPYVGGEEEAELEFEHPGFKNNTSSPSTSSEDVKKEPKLKQPKKKKKLFGIELEDDEEETEEVDIDNL